MKAMQVADEMSTAFRSYGKGDMSSAWIHVSEWKSQHVSEDSKPAQDLSKNDEGNSETSREEDDVSEPR